MKAIPRPLPLLLVCLIARPLLSSGQEARSYTAENLASEIHRQIDCRVALNSRSGRPAAEVTPLGDNEQQMVLLRDAVLRTGTIEFDFLAVPTSRFVGVAWHVESPTAYEAAYFRPFRFRDPDPVGSRHAVQYVSHPDRPWRRLRTEFPDVYESACPIDPGNWVRVRVEIGESRTRMFAGDLAKPVLVIDRPFPRTGSGVALWTGVGTTASFANVVVSPGSPTGPPPPVSPASASPLPAPLIPPATGEPIDLLATVDPDRNALIGEWTKTPDGLEVQPRPFAHVVIPTAMPASYDLDLAFTRRGSRNESVAALLPVGDRAVAVQFAAQGSHDGIGLIRSTPAWKGPTARATALASGKRVEANVRVRTRGDRATIEVLLGGQPWLSWQGPITDLSLFSAYKIPAGRAGLAAYDNNTVFHSASMKAAPGQ